MPILKNCWYVAGWPEEFKNGLISKTIGGKPIVFFRRQDGSLAALEDRCAHRHIPLSHGKQVGDQLECAYHGLRFDCSGKCVHIPAQSDIPLRAQVAAYTVAEKHGWIWVFFGDQEKADTETIPDFHWNGDPRYAATGETKHILCNYELLNDNLLDLSHVGFVHATTIGNGAMGSKGQIRVEKRGAGVRVTRWVIDCPPPPTYCKTGIFKPEDRIDRWQIIDYEPPSFINIHVGGALTGTGAPEGNRVGGLGMWVMHAMSPETEKTTNYHWSIGRDFHTNNPDITKILHKEIATAFDQDREILEIQQRAIDRLDFNPPHMDITADAGGSQARRILKRLLVAQEGASA